MKFLLEFYQRVRCDIKLVLNCDIKKELSTLILLRVL